MANNIPSATNMEPQIQSAMPPPVMQYVNQYTDEAVASGKAPKPPLPVTDSYQMFGQTCHQDDAIIRPLESQGIKRLYPTDYDKKQELKKISVSILCNFLDLLDIMVRCGVSSGRDEKIEDLNLLFINMHHLINEFRPHQARETLKVMMAMQKKNMLEAGDKLVKHMEQSAEILKKCSEEVKTLILKQTEAGGDRAIHLDSMDVDDVLSSLTSVSHQLDGVGDGIGERRKIESFHDDKDVMMCDLLDNINE